MGWVSYVFVGWVRILQVRMRMQYVKSLWTIEGMAVLIRGCVLVPMFGMRIFG